MCVGGVFLTGATLSVLLPHKKTGLGAIVSAMIGVGLSFIGLCLNIWHVRAYGRSGGVHLSYEPDIVVRGLHQSDSRQGVVQGIVQNDALVDKH